MQFADHKGRQPGATGGNRPAIGRRDRGPADPALYDDGRVGELETWNRKYAEVMDALDRTEAMWLAAQERLEAAGLV